MDYGEPRSYLVTYRCIANKREAVVGSHLLTDMESFEAAQEHMEDWLDQSYGNDRDEFTCTFYVHTRTVKV